MAALERQVTEIAREIEGSTFNESDLNALRDVSRDLENECMQSDHQIEEFYKQQNNYIFRMDYRDPEPGFDRRKVKGKLISLFSVGDRRFLKALELGAGPKLLNVVVEDPSVSKALLKRNCFNYPVTMIPNNKITYREVDQRVAQEAEHIAH
jgi:structural maintenance of chromosome 2